jgi:hypothetical protein
MSCVAEGVIAGPPPTERSSSSVNESGDDQRRARLTRQAFNGHHDLIGDKLPVQNFIGLILDA